MPLLRVWLEGEDDPEVDRLLVHLRTTDDGEPVRDEAVPGLCGDFDQEDNRYPLVRRPMISHFTPRILRSLLREHSTQSRCWQPIDLAVTSAERGRTYRGQARTDDASAIAGERRTTRRPERSARCRRRPSDSGRQDPGRFSVQYRRRATTRRSSFVQTEP